MEYSTYIDKIGYRFDIENGDLVESPSGLFTVSTTYAENTLYLNKLNKSAILIPAKETYVGRLYKLRYSDCITLWAEWVDDHLNTNYSLKYKQLGKREFVEWTKAGPGSLLQADNYFKVDVDNLLFGDTLVYSYDGVATNHIGIYLGDNKILHHVPNKLSSLDNLDTGRILGAYRYAK